MSYFYDEELPAGFQDADFEMRELEAESNRLAALRDKGFCTHGSAVGYRSEALYVGQVGLTPGTARCTAGCGLVFDDDWDAGISVHHADPVPRSEWDTSQDWRAPIA